VAGPVLRILLKLSGEALAGGEPAGIDPSVLRRLAHDVIEAQTAGVEVAVVLGGGNLFRGAALAKAGLGRVTGDHIGMLATVMNALAFRDTLEAAGARASVLSALPVPGVVDGYDRRQALERLGAGQVVIFAAGTGNPFFTTDTAACLRGIEIGADLVLKATQVDGVYSADPKLVSDARRFARLSYDEVLERDLRVMDLTAICLCRDHQLPIVVYDIATPGALARIAAGESLGTLIEPGSIEARS
jgi:uridylate kinase